MSLRKKLKKFNNKTLIAVAAAFILFLSTGSIFAVKIMKAVPQNIGFKDVKLSNLTKKMCVECHKGPLADKHHMSKNALAGDCFACHKVIKPKKGNKFKVSMDRNCIACHVKSPHHKSEDALKKNCTKCHKTPGVSKYSLSVPTYKQSLITPTVKSCRNCHGDGKVGGIDVISMKKTHHGIKLKGCDKCHEEDKKSNNIRNCQRCHSVTAMHEVGPHVEKASCKGCHQVRENIKAKKLLKKAVKKKKKKRRRRKKR